ncbi:MAG TPA: DUF2795 domain-containing protein [Myxococcaceae bacterium]|nr:DUF2795 domain-containing protein [Myxococcaceae bacterium]
MSDDETRRIRLDKALLGAVFPLATEQLIRLARENEAPSVILSLLGGLPQRRFESLEAVRQALESRPGSEEPPEAPAPVLGPEH